MEQKLIKLSDTHYIVVDGDSEIKKGDYAIHNNKEYRNKYNEKPILCTKSNCESIQEHWDKITHSTQPELLGSGWMQSVLPILLSEVEEAIYGYCVEMMALQDFKDNDDGFISYRDRTEGFINGFNAHKELVKDKLFTVEDMENILIKFHKMNMAYLTGKADDNLDIKDFINTVLPKTEWECTITPRGKIVIL